jgi:diguanylate cyclase (GGDEF)-like protein
MRFMITKAWRVPGRDQIGADQLSAVVRATPAAMLSVLVNAVIVAVSLWPAAPYHEVLAWLVLAALIVGFYLRPATQRTGTATSLSRRAMRKALTAASLSALPWALLSVRYLGALPHTSEMVLITVTAGMAGGGSVLLAPVYPAALAYMSVVLLPFALKCFTLAGAGYSLLGLLALSYAIFLAAVIATNARLSVERTEALRALTQTALQLQERDTLITTQNARFEIALSNMTQGLCFFDGDERLIVCNRRYIEMYRLDPSRLQPGIAFSDIVRMRYEAGTYPAMSPEDYQAWRKEMAAAGGPTSTMQKLKDGRVFILHYQPLAGGGWVATTDDVTEQQRLTEELEQNHKLLEERSALLQAIIDNFPGGISFYDKDLRVLLCNDKARAILGLPGSFFAGGPPRLEDILRFNARRGEYGAGATEEQVSARLARALDRTPYRFERVRPSGAVLDVRGAPIENGGFITTYMDITERYRAEAKIAHLATHDSLTGLPNRVLFRERLEQAISGARMGDGPVAVLMLDLNRFKHVNDTLGHPAGDSLLKAVGGRLAGCVRTGDVVARLGGDEFAIVLRASDPAAEAAEISRRIRAALTAPFDLDGNQVTIGTSIGIAVSSADAMDVDALIKRADVALYRAKAQGGDSYRFFDKRMEQHIPMEGAA